MQPPSLFDATMAQLSYGLDGLSQRQDIISTNIANVDTPGYLTHDVNFEQSLQSAIQQGTGNPLAVVPGALPAPTTRNDLQVRNDGNNVDVNQQMIEMAQTSLRYQTAGQMISGKFSLLAAALAPAQ